MEKIITTTIGELQDGDKVLGTDGQWHEITIHPIQTKDLYTVTTTHGNIICSHDHQWTIHHNNQTHTLTTKNLHDDLHNMKNTHIGTPNGPQLLNITPTNPNQCRCITIHTPDHQFQILTNKNQPIYTHNCAGRLIAGKLNTTASMMALGNSLATTIDGSHKGSGIVSVNSIVSHCQYYYADPDWIEDWFRDRGLTETGSEPGAEEATLEDLEGVESMSIADGDETYKFEDISKEVKNKKVQKFENI